MKREIILAFLLMTKIGFCQTVKEIVDAARTIDGSLYLDYLLNPSAIKEAEFREFEGETFCASIEEKNRMHSSDLSKRPYSLWIKAYNPLVYTVTVSSETIADPNYTRIKEALDKLLTSGIDQAELSRLDVNQSKSTPNLIDSRFFSIACGLDNNDSIKLNQIISFIRRNEGNYGIRAIDKMIKLSFENKEETNTTLNKIQSDLENLVEKYKTLKDTLHAIENKVNSTLLAINLEDPCWLKLRVLRNYLSELHDSIIQQQIPLQNCQKAIDQINSVMKAWIKQDSTNGKWFVLIKTGNVTKKESSVETIKFKKFKLERNEFGEISKNEENEESLKVQFIWHRIFIPEVSTGVFYSYLESPEFRLDNSTGTNSIVQIGQKEYEKITVSAMMNFNFNIRNSPVLPFLQVGLGMQSKLPIGMLGVGARFGYNKAFAISWGMSMTAIEGLTDFNVGDFVNSELELKEDTRYRFSSPKAYFGIQYNF